ncbi:hypothetical protein [Chthonobacter rhizosphaerae]|uniref:hypothetical protein n=1 Tax=Chthonobacter rhizosphaerae TaxID=2735553 RepID=UPI0015EF37A0|nr:hypothetical protein [Chthonobacter rhizosphaerae]
MPKTREEDVRAILSKGDKPAPEASGEAPLTASENHDPLPKHRDARQSEFPVSRQGMNQESRQHNKG